MKRSKTAKNARAKKKQLRVKEAYRTRGGKMLVGCVEDALDHAALKAVRGKVNLIFTSPPFPLVSKKRYGNETGEQYLKWLQDLAPRFCELLCSEGVDCHRDRQFVGARRARHVHVGAGGTIGIQASGETSPLPACDLSQPCKTSESLPLPQTQNS
jgi:hypothetical protein